MEVALNILLVEDQEQLRECLTELLELHGHQVTPAPNGLRALDALPDEAFDIVVSDVIMPGCDGIDLANRVLSERPGLPVLLMTGHGLSREQEAKLLRVGVPCLSKPFEIQELVRAINALVLQAGAAPAAG